MRGTTTTLYTTAGEEGLVTMTMHTDAHVVVHCSAYPDRAPILGLSHGRASFTVTAPELVVGDTDLQFARDLAASTAMYLAECERLHAEQIAETPAA
jgi:hypothetical protein